MRYAIARGALAMGFAVAIIVIPEANGQQPTPGQRLTQAMGFAETVQQSLEVCKENMAQHDVEKAVEATPGLLGGIKPGDAEWAQARELYIELLEAGCDYNPVPPEEAFVRATEEALSVADIEALVAFYATDLGKKYRAASLKANAASYRALKPTVESQTSYAEYEENLQALLAGRQKPIEKPRDLKTVNALPSADAAVALSDRIMQGVTAGKISEALALVGPHAVLSDEQIDSLVKQIKEQQPTVAARFGASLGYELLRNDTAGGSVQRTVFLQRFERHAMLWVFLWYRGRDGWVLNNVSYVDNLSLLFQ